MIDKAKRTTLKSIAATGIATAAFSLSSAASACNHLPKSTLAKSTLAKPTLASQASLNLEVTQGWAASDLKVALRNVSGTETTITQMSPAKIRTDFGDIDLSTLMETGPLRLAPGQTVSLHVQRSTLTKPNVSYSAQVLQSFQHSVSRQLALTSHNNEAVAFAQVFHPRAVG